MSNGKSRYLEEMRRPFERDGWRSWVHLPPASGSYQVIEWIRDDAGWENREPNVARLDHLLSPINAAWNVLGVWWRPVL